MNNFSPNEKVQWQERNIVDEKQNIKAELDQIQKDQGIEAKLKFINSQIGKLADDISPIGQLRRCIYVISALVHHERNGGLSTPNVKRLVDLAYAILQVQGIRPSSSKLSFMYGDIHLILSQINRRDGNHWQAAWEQQMSQQMAKNYQPGGLAYQTLSRGIRTLRIGHGNLAIKYFEEVLASKEVPDEMVPRVYLDLMKALRISGNTGKAENVAMELTSKIELSDRNLKEFAWEQLCRGASREMDLDEMIATTKKKGPHHQEGYILEAYLWTMASLSTKWIGSMPAIRTVVKNGIVKPKRAGFLFKSVKQFVELYDTSTSFSMRLRELGSILPDLHLLISVDLELLSWVAATRWLARNKSFHLASIALREYNSLSMRLSDGGTKDALNIASDLMERPWFYSAD